MRTLLLMAFLFSLKAIACGEEIKKFSPFSIDISEKDNPQSKFKVFHILSPINKDEMFLSSITARLEGEFEIDLDIRKNYTYVGEYYTSYLSVASKHVDKIDIILSYNTTKKDRSSIVFCGNWKTYKLHELTSFEPTKKVVRKPPTVPAS